MIRVFQPFGSANTVGVISHYEEVMDDMKITIHKFVAWHSSLSDIDKMNFNSVVALRLAEKLPEGPYRTMAEYATELSKNPDKITRYQELQKFLNDEEDK